MRKHWMTIYTFTMILLISIIVTIGMLQHQESEAETPAPPHNNPINLTSGANRYAELVKLYWRAESLFGNAYALKNGNRAQIILAQAHLLQAMREEIELGRHQQSGDFQ